MTNPGASSRQNQSNIDDTQRNVVYSPVIFKPKYARATFVGRYKSTVSSADKWFQSMTGLGPSNKRKRRKKKHGN